MTPGAVIEEALTWLGTPYHHGARVKGVGADCGQFPAAVFAACGLIPDIDIGSYPHDWHMHRADERYLRHVEQFFVGEAPHRRTMREAPHRRTMGVEIDADPVPVGCGTGTPDPADLALFRYGRAVSHGSIVIRWPLVIHAYVSAGAVVMDDAANNLDLASRFAGFYRLRAWA
jgi:cell wall-associated NlpC family hydrolase